MTFVWQGLDHDRIFSAAEEALGRKLSNLLLRRNSYINRVIELEELDTRQRFIAKFYRPGRWTPEMILEEHKFLSELAQKEIPVIPPLSIDGRTLFDGGGISFALFPKKGGRPLDEFDEDTWKAVGRTLARIHLVGEGHKTSIRVMWRPEEATRHNLRTLMSTEYVLPDFKKALGDAVELFIKKADPLFDGQKNILLHGDMHMGNLIHRPGEGTFVIDFDDIAMGTPVQDIWMLFPGPPEKFESELKWFMDGYETFRPFDLLSLDLIPALRGMRIIHFASWLAVQFGEPDFKGHFPEAGTKRYWNEIIKEIHSIIYDEL